MYGRSGEAARSGHLSSTGNDAMQVQARKSPNGSEPAEVSPVLRALGSRHTAVGTSMLLSLSISLQYPSPFCLSVYVTIPFLEDAFLLEIVSKNQLIRPPLFNPQQNV